VDDTSGSRSIVGGRIFSRGTLPFSAGTIGVGSCGIGPRSTPSGMRTSPVSGPSIGIMATDVGASESSSTLGFDGLSGCPRSANLS
jgi:hypothetical protein